MRETGEPCGSENLPYYHPWHSLTRAQLAKIVVQSHYIAIITPATGHTFTDVPRDHWAFGYVETAYHYKLLPTPEFPDFKPGGPTTRGDLAQATVNAPGYEFVEWTGYFYQDVANSHPQRKYIETAYARDLLDG